MYARNIITRLCGPDAQLVLKKRRQSDGRGVGIVVTGWGLVPGVRAFKVSYYKLRALRRQKYLILSVLTRTSRALTYKRRTGIRRGIEAWRKVPPCLLLEIE